MKVNEVPFYTHVHIKSYHLGYNSSTEKARLQHVMVFGIAEEPKMRQQPSVKEEDKAEEADRFEEVMGEIEERRKFLQDMAALGQDKCHRSRIMTEISQVLHIRLYIWEIRSD